LPENIGPQITSSRPAGITVGSMAVTPGFKRARPAKSRPRRHLFPLADFAPARMLRITEIHA
jgi:hypothetical protein